MYMIPVLDVDHFDFYYLHFILCTINVYPLNTTAPTLQVLSSRDRRANVDLDCKLYLIRKVCV